MTPPILQSRYRSIFCALALFLLATSTTFAVDKPFHVVLDPGHGGTDHGLKNNDLTEKDLSLLIARAVERKLNQDPSTLPVLTRQGDYNVSLDERRKIANQSIPGIFVSFHFGSAPDQNRHQTNIYALSPPVASADKLFVPLEVAHRASGLESEILGKTIEETPSDFQSHAAFRRMPYDLAPLVGIQIPAVLIEVDDLSATDASRWKQPELIESFAEYIVSAIDRYRSKGKNTAP